MLTHAIHTVQIYCEPIQNSSVTYNISNANLLNSNITFNTAWQTGGTTANHTCVTNFMFPDNTTVHTYVCVAVNETYGAVNGEWMLYNGVNTSARTAGNDCGFGVSQF
jgi:hypothetical protein